ncbi:Abi family protein [Micromonospora sp. WMMA1363]|uniref:Abi family protein n=1 Tax=Micromonospora sp. WMMA1363 TaxID=3053985 RepID=UPI00259D1B2F|nr:Abi family protein [Micromonospora sp. WMMA1363]MDM4723354.1 Abi family protein [Micromonospora sp. WMMA1363]
MTPAELAVLETRLSVERLAPYRTASGDDLRAAVRLYEFNREVAAAFGATLGDLEVLLRNAMHDQLTVWSSTQHNEPRWYLDPGRLLTTDALDDIARARRRATRTGRPETPGRVVAELTLGFWRYLLASRYERTLWLPCLRGAFPHLRGIRRDVGDAVRDLHLLRNRIAHHERIHDRPLLALHATTMNVAAWMCPVSHRWIESRCRVESLLATQPPTAAVMPPTSPDTGRPASPPPAPRSPNPVPRTSG